MESERPKKKAGFPKNKNKKTIFKIKLLWDPVTDVWAVIHVSEIRLHTRGLSSLLVCYNLILEFTNLLHCKKTEKKKEATVVVFSFLCVSNISPPQQRTIHVKHVVHPTTLFPQYRCGSISVMTWTHHHRLIWRETGDLPATPPKLTERKQNKTTQAYTPIYELEFVFLKKETVYSKFAISNRLDFFVVFTDAPSGSQTLTTPVFSFYCKNILKCISVSTNNARRGGFSALPPTWHNAV